PVLFLSNPEGVESNVRREMLDDIAALNRLNEQRYHDPEIATRISQYELAFRMQSSVPELTDLSGEDEKTLAAYGPAVQRRGRDHHPRCFTVWLAGAGIQPGFSFGETDDFSYNIAANPVHVHDLNATILHLLGIDHTRLTFKYQGRHYRLTDVHGNVVREILA